ncbi:MAG: SPASM domain-containing protein, partial [Clostridia bacterium]|nr:SPASM domain-containing protein [Clostridia bacterium]
QIKFRKRIMLGKIYLEKTNVCNLDCSFCHKTKRTKRLISEEEFDAILDKIEGRARYLFFHLMGEPTLHPSLPHFIASARSRGFLPAITTNGSLLMEKGEGILSTPPYKISISLHAPGANSAFSKEGYLDCCIDFAKRAASLGCFVALRLWNLGSGADNAEILDFLHASFPGEWRDLRGGTSQRLCERVFLEWGEQFDWPDPKAPECDINSDLFCYGLRDQVGILVDGTVVPCCLDADANVPLGNIFTEDLEAILSSPRAKAIYDGFTRRRAVESLCRRCGYARRFSK